MLLLIHALLASSLIVFTDSSPPAFGLREGSTHRLVDATAVTEMTAAMRPGAGAGPKPGAGMGTESTHRRSPRILYLVSTSPGSEDKAVAIKQTWGSRLGMGSDILFFSHEQSYVLGGVVRVPGIECGRKCLGKKEALIWQWVLDQRITSDASDGGATPAPTGPVPAPAPASLLERYDWFVKTDDDTLMIPGNLQAFLEPLDPALPHYLGRRYGPTINQPTRASSTGQDIRLFNAGGAGYVLSRATLALVAAAPYSKGRGSSGAQQETRGVRGADERAGEGAGGGESAGGGGGMLFPPRGFRWCAEKFDGDAGDTAIARCLVEYGVLAEDTRDAALRERFHPFNPETEFYSMLIDKNHWSFEYSWYGVRALRDCCSARSVSFHYIDADEMRRLDSLLYPRRRQHSPWQSSCAAAGFDRFDRPFGQCWSAFRPQWHELARIVPPATLRSDAPPACLEKLPAPPGNDCLTWGQKQERYGEASQKTVRDYIGLDARRQPLPAVSTWFTGELHVLQAE